jgi:hypothetical protein
LLFFNWTESTVAPKERMKGLGEMWRVAKATDEVAKYCAIAATMQRQEDAGELSAAQKKQEITKIFRQLSNLVCIIYACMEISFQNLTALKL